ncbi:MAG: SUMF1/EgtB/PvdO family nonheme iron enzyme [Nitrospira sp.]|jgi:formylglycine-generating enzyme required for sulfatase activity|nr:SUMF1/EgtB/PvdO family nonheme iron enzyme [Nitrospira sp.]
MQNKPWPSVVNPQPPAVVEHPRDEIPEVLPFTKSKSVETLSSNEAQVKLPLKQSVTGVEATVAKSVSTSRRAKELTGKGGAPMVLIPDGGFWMGLPDGEDEAYRTIDEHPRHRVALSAFYLDKYEVTNRRFEQFVRETRYSTTAEEEGNAWAFTGSALESEVRRAQWRKPDGHVTLLP